MNANLTLQQSFPYQEVFAHTFITGESFFVTSCRSITEVQDKKEAKKIHLNVNFKGEENSRTMNDLKRLRIKHFYSPHAFCPIHQLQRIKTLHRKVKRETERVRGVYKKWEQNKFTSITG